MNEERFYFRAGDGRDLSALLLLPESQPLGCFQILHGFAEHKERYLPFMKELAQRGWLLLIHDHRGHGESARSPEELADLGAGASPEALTGDCLALRRQLYERHPEALALPYVYLGHSMGSFMLRALLLRDSRNTDGAIIMGTGSMPPLTLNVFSAILGLVSAFHPLNYRSPLVNQLAIGTYNTRFRKEGRGPNAWLSRADENVRRYTKDPLCGAPGSLSTFRFMRDCLAEIQAPAALRSMRPDLPIFLVSGEEDPVGSFGKGPRTLEKNLRKAGMKNVDLKLYPGMRHEVLNENGASRVIQDIFKFLDEVLA